MTSLWRSPERPPPESVWRGPESAHSGLEEYGGRAWDNNVFRWKGTKMLDACVARARRGARNHGLRSHFFASSSAPLPLPYPHLSLDVTAAVACLWQYLFNKKETDDNAASE